jgi:ABC-2 type transport system permease protein
MRKVAALMRASWLTHTSYRVNVLLSIAGMAAMFVPLYFVAGALQPVVEDSIRDEGREYFGFLVVGLAVVYYLSFSMNGLSGAILRGIHSGTLESLFATPARVGEILSGLVGYDLVWTSVRAGLLVTAMWLVGTSVAWGNLPSALFILALIILAHLPIGLLAAALILVFRTSGRLTQGALAAFTLLGGVYYSTSVIPDVVQPLAAAVPLTYGLRALRRSFLAGEPFMAVAPDVAVLAGFAAVLMAGGAWVFHRALAHSRRAGTLGQY